MPRAVENIYIDGKSVYNVERLWSVVSRRKPKRIKTSELSDILIHAYEDIRSGNVLMYFPEANVLVPRTTDPQSRTPAFKGALVTLHSK